MATANEMSFPPPSSMTDASAGVGSPLQGLEDVMMTAIRDVVKDELRKAGIDEKQNIGSIYEKLTSMQQTHIELTEKVGVVQRSTALVEGNLKTALESPGAFQGASRSRELPEETVDQPSDAVESAKGAGSRDVQMINDRIQALEDRMANDQKQQEQKDKAQDELLMMQFDLVKRDMNVFCKGKDLEEQKNYLLSKFNTLVQSLRAVETNMQSLPVEMRDEMKVVNNVFKEEMIADARNAHERIEKVSQAVLEQIRLVEERLKQNSLDDEAFQARIAEWLKKVENELGWNDSGPGSLKDLNRRVQILEGKWLELESTFEEIHKRMEEIKEEMKDYVNNIPQPEPQKVQVQVQEVKKKVEKIETTLEPFGPDPLEWLRKRVGEIAAKDHTSPFSEEAKEIPKRIEKLQDRIHHVEVWRKEASEQVAELFEYASSGGPATTSYVPPPKQEEPEDDEESGSDDASPTVDAGMKIGDPELSYVNLFKDMERLRGVIECMEEVMPMQVRSNIAFFKMKRAGDAGGKKGKKRNKSPGRGRGRSPAGKKKEMVVEEEIMGLRREADENVEKIQQCEEKVSRERQNMQIMLKNYDREHNKVKEKVEDLCRKLLKPGTAIAQDLGASGGNVSTELQRAVQDVKAEVDKALAEVRGELGGKASEDEVKLLKDRLERWARSPTRSPPAPSSTYSKSFPGPNSRTQGMSQTVSNDQCYPTVSGASHHRCKSPTCPSTVKALPEKKHSGSQSASRLPTLSGITRNNV